VKLDKLGQVIYAKYTIGTPRPTIDGVCAHLVKVKFIPSKEVPKRAPPPPHNPAPKHQRTIVADLEQQVALLTKIVRTIEESHHVLARSILTRG
jgi:hypothetical protein